MEHFNWLFLLISVMSLALSAWVLMRQEFGRADISGTLGPKIYIYHESPSPLGERYARLILPVTLTNESPRGGCILKMELCISQAGSDIKHILGWLYEVEIAATDLENPAAQFRKKQSGNPFYLGNKSSITKYLYFDANTDSHKNNADTTISGLQITQGTWDFSLLVWTRETELYNFSISESLRLSQYDSGVLTYQVVEGGTSSHIFYFSNKPNSYNRLAGDLRQHYRKQLP